jgi:hypothetical protein
MALMISCAVKNGLLKYSIDVEKLTGGHKMQYKISLAEVTD